MTKECFKKLRKILKYFKILILTHTDPDGSGPVVCLKEALGDANVTVKHCTNATMSKDIVNTVLDDELMAQYDLVIACDISCNADDAKIINASKNIKKFIDIDHHDTAMFLNNYPWGCVVSDIIEDSFRTRYYKNLKGAHSSGTSLMYDYLEYNGLFKDKSSDEISMLQEFVHIIAAYDTWDWFKIFGKEQKYKDMNTLFNFYTVNAAEDFENRFLDKIRNHGEMFDAFDKEILKVTEKKISSYVLSKEKQVQVYQAIKFDFDDRLFSCAYVFSKDYPQEVFEMMMEREFPDLDLYIVAYGDGYSVRTKREDIHVGHLLENLKGGGHAGAAGLRVPFEVINDRMESDLHITSIISYR